MYLFHCIDYTETHKIAMRLNLHAAVEQSTILLICATVIVCGQITFLDNYITSYRKLRTNIFHFIGRSDTETAYKWNLDRGVIYTHRYRNLINY